MQEQTEKIVNLLSRDRFEACRYRGEDDERTLCRVIWNTALSEALYSPLQGLEVGVRNSIHLAISNLYGGPNWISVPGSYLRPGLTPIAGHFISVVLPVVWSDKICFG
jgi:hypothetical protein